MMDAPRVIDINRLNQTVSASNSAVGHRASDVRAGEGFEGREARRIGPQAVLLVAAANSPVADGVRVRRASRTAGTQARSGPGVDNRPTVYSRARERAGRVSPTRVETAKGRGVGQVCAGIRASRRDIELVSHAPHRRDAPRVIGPVILQLLAQPFDVIVHRPDVALSS